MSFRVPEHQRITDGPMGSPREAGLYGAFVVESPEPGWQLALVCDDGTHADVPESLGWEHVSVHAFSRVGKERTPTWKEMHHVKTLCWEDEDVVVQFHPRRSEYVNVHPHVLHLWRHRTHPFPVPQPVLV